MALAAALFCAVPILVTPRINPDITALLTAGAGLLALLRRTWRGRHVIRRRGLDVMQQRQRL